MANPLFQALGGGVPQDPMLQQFPKFMQMMRGKDPNQMINELVSSGRINQEQLDAVQQRAQQVGGMFSQFKTMFNF